MQAFVTRQPIFKTDLSVMGYELLFRAGIDDLLFPQTNGDAATSSVISDGFFTLGIDTITAGKKAFINFTRSVLLADYAQLLPQEVVVVEILEDIVPDAEVLEAVNRLKEMGYTIAVDDYAGSDMQAPFLDLADIIKVDFSLTNAEQQQSFAQKFLPRHIRLLAEKVETYQEFKIARDAGYSLFQGFFFCRPTLVTRTRIPETKISKVELIKAVSQSELNFQKIEDIIKSDVSLSYKLLRFINSAFFGLRHDVNNIQQALVLLGEDKVRKWGALMGFSGLGMDKPSGLLVTAITRARFCELLEEHIQISGRKDDLFLMGMFSTIDAMLDMPMEKVLEQISISEELRSALLGEPGILRQILDLVIGYEAGDWKRVASLTQFLNLDENVLPLMYTQGMTMAEEILALEMQPVA
jgi:EAL and modified HD-GYP domain-containing signal transduction protein